MGKKVELCVCIGANEFLKKIKEIDALKLVDVTKVEIDDESILTFVAKNGYVEVFDYLVGLNMPLSENDFEALKAAASYKQVAIIERYLTYYEPTMTQEWYMSILEQLPSYERWDIVKKMFEISKERLKLFIAYIPYVYYPYHISYLFSKYPGLKNQVLVNLDKVTYGVSCCMGEEVVNYFIDLGIDPNKLIAYAVANASEIPFKVAIQRGADINQAIKMVLLNRVHDSDRSCFNAQMIHYLREKGTDFSLIDQATLNYAEAIGNLGEILYLSRKE